MSPIIPTETGLLPEVAKCHNACFPLSLSTRLGINYIIKTLDWFLAGDQRFLYHIEVEGQVAGYCGGFIPQKKGDGSSSGMLQHGFSEAIKGLIKKPWLVFHPEVVQQYSFLARNIKRKFTGKINPASVKGEQKPFKSYVGLVVIGVHPNFRGTGIAQQLMNEFEQRVKHFNQHDLVLTVKKNNTRAIKAYQNFGWNIAEENKETYLMRKEI